MHCLFPPFTCTFVTCDIKYQLIACYVMLLHFVIVTPHFDALVFELQQFTPHRAVVSAVLIL